MTLTQFSESIPSHFHAIADALLTEGWLVLPDFLGADQWLPLLQRAQAIDSYQLAGIGRGDEHQANPFVRNDNIFWLQPDQPEDARWLDLMEALRQFLNRQLFLGLFEFECHYARYAPGSFYKRHLDAFKGQGIRMVSVVFYLNPNWQPGEGGELVMYPPTSEESCAFQPQGGTLAVFLSEEFPHEVLAASRTRYSIAGWFRVNTTTGDRLDPPA